MKACWLAGSPVNQSWLLFFHRQFTNTHPFDPFHLFLFTNHTVLHGRLCVAKMGCIAAPMEPNAQIMEFARDLTLQELMCLSALHGLRKFQLHQLALSSVLAMLLGAQMEVPAVN